MSVLCETKGFRVGAVSVPPFTLHRGEWIMLRWPADFGSDSESQLYDLFSSRDPCPQLVLHAPVRVVTPFGKWAESLYRGCRTVGELLAALRLEDRDQLKAEIEPRGVPSSAPLNHLPGTTRALAGLMLGSALGEILVFNTSGLDPMGVRKVYACLNGKMKLGLGLIELAFSGTGKEPTHPVPVVIHEARFH